MLDELDRNTVIERIDVVRCDRRGPGIYADAPRRDERTTAA